MRRRKLRLWKQDPHCHWCGVETVIVDCSKIKTPPDNLATVDHLRSRLNPNRGKDSRESTVLSCLKCNMERGAAEQAGLTIEELHKRSGYTLNYEKSTVPFNPVIDVPDLRL